MEEQNQNPNSNQINIDPSKVVFKHPDGNLYRFLGVSKGEIKEGEEPITMIVMVKLITNELLTVSPEIFQKFGIASPIEVANLYEKDRQTKPEEAE